MTIVCKFTHFKQVLPGPRSFLGRRYVTPLVQLNKKFKNITRIFIFVLNPIAIVSELNVENVHVIAAKQLDLVR